MDLGAVGWDGMVRPETNDRGGGFGSLGPLDAETRKKKLMGSEGVGTEDDWRGPKKQRSGSAVRSGVNAHNNNNNNNNNNNSSNNGSNSYNNYTLLFSEVPHHQPQQQMLCFSSSPPHHKPEASFPNYYHNSSGARNAGYNPGCLVGVRGPFTPSQWMELEHQALIYKYMTANMSISSNLIMPIKRALESAGLSPFTGVGWGSFHLGFSSNNDPEPGRCRRTDGKKWRCSRDAVADQKYCERHMNRGRHRSRKPVEGRTGNTAAAAARRLVQPLAAADSSPQPVVVLAAGADAQHLYQDKTSAAPTHSNCSGVYLNKENVGGRLGNAGGLSMLSDTNTMDLKSSKQAPPDTFSCPKHDEPISYQESEFGLVSSDSFFNPSHDTSQHFLHTRRCFGPLGLDKDPETPLSLRRFMDDWPKNQQSSRSPMSWPDMDSQSNHTQLSISIPANKVTLSPLRLSHELDPIEMGLGVGSDEPHNRQANWVPISWGATSVGGPLGEVLHTTSGHGGGFRNSSAFNLDGWDGGGDSPRMESSPTGVLQLQKTTPFGSLSNSSAGSSPRAQEGASLCNDFLVNAASRPSL